MRGLLKRSVVHGGPQFAKPLASVDPAVVCKRIGALWNVSLPDVHRQPRRRAEQVGIALNQAAVATEMLDLGLERIGNVHCRAIAPEFGVIARRELVVQDQEIADPLVLVDGNAVVLLDHDGIEGAVGKQGKQLGNAGLDQMNRG